MTDYAAAYGELRQQMLVLLADRTDAELEKVAPATPQWRVRDVVAHLGGVCDDIANGNMDGVASDPWTQAQVDKRAEWPFPRVLDDWSEHAAVVEPLMNSFGQPIGQMIFDAWTHEQDVRGALDAPGGRDTPAMEISWAWLVETNQASATKPGGLLVVTEAGSDLLGQGEPSATLRTTRFEFLRAVTGRRSRAQVRALDSDVVALDDMLFVSDFFRPANDDIIE
jgi:uncharacterized protein (TIGR03083 family)